MDEQETQSYDPNAGREMLDYLEKWPNLAYKPTMTEWQITHVVQYARWLENHVSDLEELLAAPIPDTSSAQDA